MSDGSHLIVGGDSLIGGETAAILKQQGKTVITTTRRDGGGDLRLDLADPKTWNLPPGVSVAYLFAAITSTDECRRDPAGTSVINVDRTAELAGRLGSDGAFVIILSTSLVFDGSVPNVPADAAFTPKTEYGRQKARLEEKTAGLGALRSVLRPAKVLSPGTRLLREWYNSLLTNKRIRAFSDFPFAPLPLNYLAELIVLAAERRLDGIIQASSPDEMTYAELATSLAEEMRLPVSLVESSNAKSSDAPPEHIPQHATLDSSRAHTLGRTPPAARETARNVIRSVLG